MTQQIKHETGHVQFRVQRENAIGQNSLQLSGSTLPIEMFEICRFERIEESAFLTGIPRRIAKDDSLLDDIGKIAIVVIIGIARLVRNLSRGETTLL